MNTIDVKVLGVAKRQTSCGSLNDELRGGGLICGTIIRPEYRKGSEIANRNALTENINTHV
jgi:hypothetical protein